MRVGIAVMAVLAVTGLNGKERLGNVVVAKSDQAQAITTYTVKTKHHTRYGINDLVVRPFITESFDHKKRVVGLELTAYVWGSFTAAPILIVTDGKTLVPRQTFGWVMNPSGTATTIVEGEMVVRGLADAKEAYLTIYWLGTTEHMSFKLSAAQLDDCRLMLEKFRELSRLP
jgi:hypothetical protein